jgi:hypothetical protein
VAIRVENVQEGAPEKYNNRRAARHSVITRGKTSIHVTHVDCTSGYIFGQVLVNKCLTSRVLRATYHHHNLMLLASFHKWDQPEIHKIHGSYVTFKNYFFPTLKSVKVHKHNFAVPLVALLASLRGVHDEKFFIVYNYCF